MSSLALCVKSHAYMGGATTPETYMDKWDNSCTLATYADMKAPVVDVQSTDLICRSPDMADDRKPFSIGAGETIRLTWAIGGNATFTEEPIKGPCSFWLAKQSFKGIGPNWSKIQEYTNNGKTGEDAKWCTDEILTTYDGKKKAGTFDVQIPEDIEPGLYILRSEIIDILHAEVTNYDDYTMGARYYPNCLVLDITGEGTTPLKGTADIMKEYKKYYKTPLLASPSAKFVYPGPKALTTTLSTYT
ncbi:hypothetical protein GGI20_001014 [Coemansia sp. BCRC 34301]|nr:hypothetical protein GGI20_001014 [Coemansia sp. BCRC 34301]